MARKKKAPAPVPVPKPPESPWKCRPVGPLGAFGQKCADLLGWVRGKLPHPLVGIVTASTLAFVGHGEVLLRGFGLVFVAIWLIADLWNWLLQKRNCYTTVVGCALSSIVLIAVMHIMLWLLNGYLEDERNDTFLHLTGNIYSSPSGTATEAIFTIKNEGQTGLADHRLACVVNFAEYGTTMIFEKTPVWITASLGLPLSRGGGTQSTACLSIVSNLQNLTCGDITYKYDYVLATQPGQWQSKTFRFVTMRFGNRLGWYGQPNTTEAKPSPCQTEQNKMPDTSNYKRVSLCSSGCDYSDLKTAVDSSACGTVVYVEQTQPMSRPIWFNPKICDQGHQLIIIRSADAKKDAMHIVEQ